MKKAFVVILLVLCIGAVAIGVLLLQKESTQPRKSAVHRWAAAFENKFSDFEPVSGPSVGLVRVFGPITFSQSQGMFDAYPRGALRIVRELKNLREDPNVKSIVIQINSPGGTVGSVQEICNEIHLAQKEGKKVIASVADMAFSGGYYIASACDEIVANPGSLTGSIGVIIATANLEGLLRMLGIKYNVIKSGKHKDIASFWREMTPEERELLQALIMDCYQQFVDEVSKGRNIPLDELLPMADGRIFTGTMALERRLIDGLGTLDDAINRAAELGGIEGKPRIVRPIVEPFEKFFRFLDSRFGGPSLKDMLVGELDSPLQFRANLGPAEAAFAYPMGLQELTGGN
ncbi:signal peptide peptidase SppA [bacterium]|nr:signal peptide peptidase SppA [bacterium]